MTTRRNAAVWHRRAEPRLTASAVCVFLGLAAGSGPAVAAPDKDAGRAEIVAGEASTRPLAEGGSATAFSLRLPVGASCPGDSANGGYRVQGFMVPADDDPGHLRYQLEGPDVPGGRGLYALSSDTYTQVQTAQAGVPGGPGQIINVPAFSFAVFNPGDLAQGPYWVGIACSRYNETTRYWATEMVLTIAPGDRPAGIHWRAATPGEQRASTSPARPIAGLVVVVAVAGTTAGAVRRRSRRPVSARPEGR